MRPAKVKVDVLPPVDTSKWSVRTINDHVAEVRGMFLKALDQEDEEDALQALTKERGSERKKPAPKRKSPTKRVPTRKPSAKKAVTKKPVVRAKVTKRKPVGRVTKKSVATKKKQATK